MGSYSSLSFTGLSKMRKSLFFFTFILCTVVISSFSFQKPSVETNALPVNVGENRPIRILGLGDSLTQGVGDPLRKGYIGMIQDQLETNYGMKVTLANESKKGLTSKGLLKKVKKKHVRREIQNADLIFITIGGNDIVKVFQNHFFHLDILLFEKESKTFAHHLTEILKIIRKENREAPVFMIGLFNPFVKHFSEVVEINEIIHEWDNQAKTVLSYFDNTHFVPVEAIFVNGNDLLHDDYFHPNQEGYEKMADAVMVQLEEILLGE